MRMLKRVFVFASINILIVVSLSLVLSILGVKPYLNAYGLDITALATFCLIWGFVGVFISLALSRIMAKWMMGVKVISDHEQNPQLLWLKNTTHRLAAQAALPKMPEVGFYEAHELNAFATGPTKSRSLVAISTGLLNRMNKEEVEAVLAHEVAHIANGDMVTMTLVQGVVNSLVMFVARLAAWSASQFVDEEKRGMVNFALVILFEILLGFLGMMAVAYVSRQREFRADAGGAQFVGKASMARALESLKINLALPAPQQSSMNALKISQVSGKGILQLLSTHPSLDDRIERLLKNA